MPIVFEMDANLHNGWQQGIKGMNRWFKRRGGLLNSNQNNYAFSFSFVRL